MFMVMNDINSIDYTVSQCLIDLRFNYNFYISKQKQTNSAQTILLTKHSNIRYNVD